MHTLCILSDLHYRIHFNHKHQKYMHIKWNSSPSKGNKNSHKKIPSLFINLDYKRNTEKLRGFWPDTKFATPVFVTVWTPFPFFLSASHSHMCTHTHTHTHRWREGLKKPPHPCMRKYAHIHTHTALSVYITFFKKACSVGLLLIPLCQQTI